MLLKHNDNTNGNNIEEYPIITEYKYLGILINDKMNIKSILVIYIKNKMNIFKEIIY